MSTNGFEKRFGIPSTLAWHILDVTVALVGLVGSYMFWSEVRRARKFDEKLEKALRPRK